MSVTLSRMQAPHARLLANLWQYYQLGYSVREQSDVDGEGRFETPDEFFSLALCAESGSSAHLIQCDGSAAGFLIVDSAQIEGKPISEFADLFILPRYRGRGVASAVVEQVILRSTHPWLIAVFRDDMHALAFWRTAFRRLPFSSCREIVPPELPQFHEFVVNEHGP